MARETPKLYMQLNIHIFKVSVPFFLKDQTLNVTCKITDYILAPQPLLLDRMNKMNKKQTKTPGELPFIKKVTDTKQVRGKLHRYIVS